MNNTKIVQWILRIAVAGEFIGHGALALQGNPKWFKYFQAVGITGDENIATLLLLVGIADIALAIMVLIKPIRPLVLWMAAWGLWTALIRWPIGPDDPVWDFVERWANWGAPLALFFLLGRNKDKEE